MKLTRYTDFALRVLMHLAARAEPRSSIAEVARVHGISENHLMKVVQDLGRQGFLTTVRGRGGGFALAEQPGRIRIGDVVRHAEGTMVLVECFDRDTNTCPLARACGLKGILSEAFEAFLAVLDRYTLADLVAQPRWVATLTRLPHAPAQVLTTPAGARR